MTVTLDNDGEFTAKIDKFDLHDGLARQPQMVYNAATRAARAQKAYDDAKADLVRTTAELDREIRDNPAVYGIEKLTEKVVEQSIYAQKEYAAAIAQVNKTKYESAMADAEVTSLADRKRSLTKLVDLWIHEYYSDRMPKQRTQSEEEFDKIEARSRGRRRMEMRESVSDELQEQTAEDSNDG